MYHCIEAFSTLSALSNLRRVSSIAGKATSNTQITFIEALFKTHVNFDPYEKMHECRPVQGRAGYE